MQRKVLWRCLVQVFSHHGDPSHESLCKSEGFFILLLLEWSIFPAAGARKVRGKTLQGDTTPGPSANSAITANVLSYQIQVNLYVDYVWKKLNVCK